MQKVLVTGGAGFIGSHVVDLLIDKGYRVIIIDNLSNGKTINLNPKAKFYKADITKDISKIIAKEKPKICIHLAAQISVINSMKDPVFDAKTNILGSINLLKSCAKAGVKKFVYISSAAKFGEPKKIKVKEEYPCNPTSPYGISKHAVEHYLPVFHMDYTIITPANVYGPRQDPKGEAGVISIFIDTLTKGKSCKIFGNGKQTRDFVYVKDLAKAVITSLRKTTSKTYNIGSGKATSVNSLYNQLQSLIGKGSKKYEPPRKGEVKHFVFDISKARKELKWKPETSLKKGLRETITWFKLHSK